VFINGQIGGVWGLYRSDDQGATWIRINDTQHQYGWIKMIAGDPRVYGRCYVGASGRGVHYGDLPAPAAPSGLTATAVSASEIDLTWTDNANDETGFKIQRKTGAGGTYAQVGTVDAGVTNYSDAGLGLGTEYFYQVCATNAGGDSPFSSEASATTFTNSTPIFVAISNQTVNVGQTLVLTASATDTDQPPQNLTFTLLNGPANGTFTQIDNNNATFTWQPWVTDANTTNPVTWMVTDDGYPSMSATQSLMVTVSPLTLPILSPVTVSQGQFTLQVTNAMVGPDYAVQTSSNLVTWTTVFTTNLPSPGSIQWSDTNAAVLPAQFYRLVVGPPLP
jgi:hypothetical protein